MAKPKPSPKRAKPGAEPAASSSPGDDDAARAKAEKERLLRERVRERLAAKARSATAATEAPPPASSAKRDRDDADAAEAPSDAKRPKRDDRPPPDDEKDRAGPSAPRPGGWTLDAESDDDDDETLNPPPPPGAGGDSDEDDPLEAFMLANDAAMDADREAARRKEAAREEAARAKKEARTRDAEAAETALAFAAAAAKAAKAAARAARAAVATGDEAVEEADANDRREGNVAAVVVSDEVDPLDAFMAENNAKAEAMLRSSRDKKTDASETVASGGAKTTLAGGVLLKTSAGGGGAFFGGGRLAASRRKPSSLRPSGGAARGATSARRAAYASSDDESSGEDDSSDASSSGRGSDSDDEAWAKKQSGRMSKAEKLGVTDHSAVAYAPFRKNFYIESYEIARMTKEETKALRAELEGITCRGVAVPKPIRTWAQCGLSNRVMELIRRSGFERPTPIQCQALPAIMSGRDCVGVAKTGSGKTLAYVLPMLRHVKDQPAIEQGDGPIGMIMGPTRELVTQIGKDCKKFGRAAGLVAASVYGGSGVAAQIGELKRGCEIVACTPGRMIDVLTTGAGRITNLRRVTYMVLDEADRMFDMGFEPQITRIMNNLRPDRQTVMFSATFPRAMEALARSALSDPVEIQVGGKSVVNSDIEQLVEMREEEDRFLRALELLGEWYERGKIIIFVAKQDKCDRVFRDLLRSGYPCLSLHGGKEQTDRECTIADFKSDVCNVLVATSVAARGLDVKDLRLVINYDTPNHLEDYVHRVGRTGRAGNKGTAVTFISSEEAKFAPDLVKAMTDAKQPVPADLRRMADEVVAARKKAGKKGAPSAGGFGGSGFAFSREERDAERRAKRNAARAAGLEVEEEDHLREKEEDSDDEKFDDDGEPVYESIGRPGAASSAAAAAEAARAQAEAAEKEAEAALRAAQAGGDAAKADPLAAARLEAMRRAAAVAANAAHANAAGGASGGISSGQSMPPPPARPGGADALALAPGAGAQGQQLAALGSASSGAARAAAFAAALNARHAAGGAAARNPALGNVPHFESELEINDFPQHARWKVTHKDSLAQIQEDTDAAITTKGQYYPPGKIAPPGERKLYLLIEAPTERGVKEAKSKIKEIIETAIAKESLPGGFQAKYKV